MFPTLRRGDHGDDVALLQRVLRDLGYEVGSVDGDFGPQTENAVTMYQLNQDIDNTVEEQGVCGEHTWASIQANFGDLDGLRAEAIVEDYVEGAHGVWTGSMTAEERLAVLEAEINQALAAADVPNVNLHFDASLSDYAAFDYTGWVVMVEPSTFQPGHAATLTSVGMAEVSSAVYDQAREAEKWYDVARVLAGRHGLDPQTITTQLGIPLDVSMLAYANPSQEPTITHGVAFDWYGQAYGPGDMGTRHAPDPQDADGAIQREWRDYVDGEGRTVSLPTLRRGDYNNDQVRYLQQLLQWRDLYQGHAVDGDFGPRTEEAVKAFQGDRGLDADGIAGPLTWEALLP